MNSLAGRQMVTKIAFTSSADIYVMNAQDGSNQTNLTMDPATDEFPSWSPMVQR